jgi:hypothetical protein
VKGGYREGRISWREDVVEVSWRKDVVEGRDVVEVEGGCSSRTLTLNVVCGPDTVDV